MLEPTQDTYNTFIIVQPDPLILQQSKIISNFINKLLIITY